MSKRTMTEEEMLKEIEHLQEAEDQQNALSKKLTGKELYENHVTVTKEGKVIIDPDDPKQKKLWDLD